MSQLILRQTAESANASGITIFYAGIFFGADVPGGTFQFTEGGAEALRVDIPAGSTIAQINAAIRTAVDAKAAALGQGFTVASNGIFVPGFTKD